MTGSTTEKPKLISRYRSFEGWVEFYSHLSHSTKTEMKFSVFLPPQVDNRKVPVLYWLSGLTCTEENFMVKSGAQQFASQKGLMIVCPDTSPRGANIDGEDKDWDFGTGAGFYVNATTPKWKDNYRMYDYVSQELPAILETHFPAMNDRQGVSGHSMGGHGALVLALRQPGRYLSVSAFSPICAPSQCAWGQKAFSNYLGEDKTLWAEYDANVLVEKTHNRQPILIDQGLEDPFLAAQLLPRAFQDTCARVGQPLTLRMHRDYDHSYYFVASFIKDHIEFHANVLNRF